jgi:hypothetical protein
MSKINIARHVLCLLLGLVLPLAGCSDGEDGPVAVPDGAALSGTVTDRDTGEVLDEATVVLLHPDFSTYAVRDLDGSGAFSFSGVPAGSYMLYVLLSDYMMADASQTPVELGSGGSVTVDVTMLQNPEEMLDHEIRGVVTDAVTGDPVGGVWIAATGLAEAGNTVRYLTGNSGTTLTVSGEDGSYTLPVFAVRSNGGMGDIIGLSPISVGRSGYRPRTFAGDGPDHAHEWYLPGGLLPAPADSVLVLDIALEPVPAGGVPAAELGTIRGRVVSDEDQPEAGVWVNVTLMALADRDTVFAPDKVSVDGGWAQSGDDGTWGMRLEPGFYSLRAGLLPDDGWAWTGSILALEIVAGETYEAGDVHVGAAVRPLTPEAGAVLTDPTPTLAWTAANRADSYRVIGALDGRQWFTIGTTSDTTLVWPFGAPGEAPRYDFRWQVQARRDVDGSPTTFTMFEVPAAFTIRYD